jgi:DNA invertase Pin-like site-specific DNA recombinase
MVATQSDEFTSRMFGAVNALMLDVLAAVARKNYEDRRRRVAQGQAKAKAEGRYRGRPEDGAKNARIARMLNAGLSWSQIQETLHCSRGTVAKVALRMRQEEAAAEARVAQSRARAGAWPRPRLAGELGGRRGSCR